MEFKPNDKFLTKQWLGLSTLSVIIILAGLILQILIPLSKDVTAIIVAPILWSIVGALIILLWVIAVPLTIVWVKNLKFVVEDDRVTIYKGIISRIQQNIPYRAVTDFMLHRSLYDRYLNIGSIRIQTAGQSANGTGYEGELSGLVEYDKLHKQLRATLRSLHPKSEATTTFESTTPVNQDEYLLQILIELKKIREDLKR